MTVLASRKAGPLARNSGGVYEGKGRGPAKPCNCENFWLYPLSQGFSDSLLVWS